MLTFKKEGGFSTRPYMYMILFLFCFVLLITYKYSILLYNNIKYVFIKTYEWQKFQHLKNLFKDYIKFCTLLHTGTRFYSNVTFLNTHVVLKITPLVIDSHQLKSLRLLLISTSKEYLWLFDLGQMGEAIYKITNLSLWRPHFHYIFLTREIKFLML